MAKFLDLPDYPKLQNPQRAIKEAIEEVRAEALLLGVTLEPCPFYSDTILLHHGETKMTWELQSAGSANQLRREVHHFWRTIKGFPKPDEDVTHTSREYGWRKLDEDPPEGGDEEAA